MADRPTIQTPIPKAATQAPHKQRTVWSGVVGVLCFAVQGFGQAAPSLVPFIHDPKWQGLLSAAGAFALALAAFFGRQGAVDDSAHNAALMDAGKGGS